MKKRVTIVVLDSVGCGEMPDAVEFGDVGSNTIGNIIKVRGLDVPNLAKLGLFSIPDTGFGKDVPNVVGNYGKCAEVTKAKDTTSGHWEMAGYLMPAPFRTFPEGFPISFMEKYEAAIGKGTIGNEVASGTEIIMRLGDEHVATGKPIIYTSADSVFQIAAHEDIIPLDELYRICEVARKMLVGDMAVGRVIARPFIGSSGAYARTENRRDFALAPETDTILDAIKRAGLDVVGIGKIEDIFAHRGLTEVMHTTNNAAGIEATIAALKEDTRGLIFTNLVDFDMLYGHRNDVESYASALEYFDRKLPEIMESMGPEDILIISADHGCDPTTASTDHSREYIPLLVYGQPCKQDVNLGVRKTFADIGASIVDYLGLEKWNIGQSFWPEIRK